MAISEIGKIEQPLYLCKNDNTRISVPIKPAVKNEVCDPAIDMFVKTGQTAPIEINSDLSKDEQIRKGIQQVALRTALSEDFLNNLLLKEEKLRLYVYDDRVKDNPQDEHGTYTVGYGHTGSVPGRMFKNSKYDPTKEYEITSENKADLHLTIAEAFELLERDLQDAKDSIITFLGNDNFINAPKPIQEGIIDAVFNKGIKKNFINNPDSPTYNLKNALIEANKTGDYSDVVACMIYETKNPGLKKRNMYRVLHVIQGLSTHEERLKALDNVQQEYKSTLNALKNKGKLGFLRALKLEYDWNKAVKNM